MVLAYLPWAMDSGTNVNHPLTLGSAALCDTLEARKSLWLNG
jgi:hypothetical protein